MVGGSNKMEEVALQSMNAPPPHSTIKSEIGAPTCIHGLPPQTQQKEKEFEGLQLSFINGWGATYKPALFRK